MLRPYTLESPPPLPPFDGEWREGGAASWGRRVRPADDGVEFPGAVTLTALVATGGAERRAAALEEPCLIWEVTGAGELTIHCHVDLGTTDLRYERDPAGTRLWLGAESRARECLVGCAGGALTIEAEGRGARLTARGTGRLRLLIIAATGEGDRDQVLRVLARRGFGGMQDQQRRHADQVRGLAVAVTTPAGVEDRLVAETVRALDGALVEEGGYRSAPDLVRTGTGLLAAGLREQARDLLRAPFDGVGPLRLYARYAEWAGDDDFLRKRWPEAARAIGLLAAERKLGAVAADLLPVAELVGDLGIIGMLDGASAASRDGAVAAATPVEEVLRERWGVVPAALDGMVRLAPALPAEWDRMTLERLRVGRTVLDLRIKRRPGGVSCQVRVAHGPGILVHLAPVLPFVPAGLLVGDEQLPGPDLRVMVEQELDAVWLA